MESSEGASSGFVDDYETITVWSERGHTWAAIPHSDNAYQGVRLIESVQECKNFSRQVRVTGAGPDRVG
jgi:hypothetical protein